MSDTGTGGGTDGRRGYSRPQSTSQPVPTDRSNAIAHIRQAVEVFEEERRHDRLSPMDQAFFLLALAQAEAALAVTDSPNARFGR